jgi:soluble lytic murein transglycosylase-like protein
MNKDSVLLTHLLIESIVEEHAIDEVDLKKLGRRAVATAAVAGALYGGSQLYKNSGNAKEKPGIEYSIKNQEIPTHSEILMRQAYKESNFNPKAISPKGAKGLTQIMPSALTDYLKRTGKKAQDVNLDDIKQSIDIQLKTMESLYNASFIDKENQSEVVRLAKTLAAYNYGRGNVEKLLTKVKEEGGDIYNSLDWVKRLPKETSDYVNKILLAKDSKFEKNYKKAIESQKNRNIVGYYKKIKDLEK